VNTQHSGPLCPKSFEVLRPFDERDAVLLPLINDASAQGITSWRESIRIHMPDRQVAAMLRNEDERWRGQLGFCMQCGSDGASERCLPAPEIAGEKDSITWPK
jgi:hypothetical protein